MKYISVILLVYFSSIFNVIAQKRVKYSFFLSPQLCVLNEFEAGKEISNYRTDIYDYRNISSGWQYGVSAELKLASKYYLTGIIGLSDEKYTFSNVVHDYSGGTYSKFIITNSPTFILTEIGLKKTISEDEKWFISGSVGYKTLFGMGGSILQLDNFTNNAPATFSFISASSPRSGGFPYLSLGVEKKSTNNRFTYGLHFQRSIGFYPKSYLTTGTNAVRAEGWSAPKVHCFSFRLSYNLGIKKK
jgi:hypothetical protein